MWVGAGVGDGGGMSMLAIIRIAPLLPKGVSCCPLPRPRLGAAGFGPGLFVGTSL